MASTYSCVYVHIVFATQGRRANLADAWRADLHAYIGGTFKQLGATPYAVGGMADHVHALIGLGAKNCIADLVRDVKRASGRWIGDRTPSFGWQAGYGAFSINRKEIDTVVRYIAEQERHHRILNSAEELVKMLEDFGIPYDPRYFE